AWSGPKPAVPVTVNSLPSGGWFRPHRLLVRETKTELECSTIMKRSLKQMSNLLAPIILLSGCCTTRHATHWEYKVAEPPGSPNNTRQALEPFLNEMAKDGWIFMERDATGWCYFKRQKQ